MGLGLIDGSKLPPNTPFLPSAILLGLGADKDFKLTSSGAGVCDNPSAFFGVGKTIKASLGVI